VYRIHLAQDRGELQSLVNTVINFWVPQDAISLSYLLYD